MTLRRLELATSWGPLSVIGGSRAGEGTLILLPQLRLALDPGRPHRALPAMSTTFISHGHLDHLGGLGYWASQRFLQAMGPAELLAPEPIADGVARLLELHAELEGGRPYSVTIAPVSDGASRPLRRDIEMRFFDTDHWVPTLGTELVWITHRLRTELAGLPGEEIARLRAAGEQVTQPHTVRLFAYCADTGPGLLATRPATFGAEVVLLECSFFRPSDRDRAARYGHLHVDQLVAAADRLRCRHLVLLHASRRHRLREVEERIARDIEPRLDCEVHHLLVDWD